MTRQEKNKLIEYLIKHEYNKLDTLRGNDIYTKKNTLGKSVRGFDIFSYVRIEFYDMGNNHHFCVLESRVYEKDNSNIYDMMSIQKKIESTESFIAFEKVITLSQNFCREHIFKNSKTELEK